jgi:RNA polymerase sigma-70 factor (family 1)
MERSVYYSEVSSEEEAFQNLYRLFYKPGIAFLMTIVKDREESENMLQDVFMKIWLRKEKIALDISLKPYIFTSLKNIAFDYLKKMERDNQMKKTFLERMQEPYNQESINEDVTVKVVSSAIARLSEKRKMIIKLNIEDGKSYQEIAQIMQISKNTVKNQLIKAKQHLRNYIEYPILTS